jgi:hypothetical protein
MTLTLLPQQAALVAFDASRKLCVAPAVRADVGRAVLAFLDLAGTATGQATFYNTQAEQQAAEEAVHQTVFTINRGLYALLLTLPGVTHHALQVGMQRLLDTPAAQPGSFLTGEQETQVIHHLAANLPPQRLFKLFGMLQERRINNRRTRRLILRSILSSRKLAYWAVKYRSKLRQALRHAWGVGVSQAVKAMAVQGDERHGGAKHVLPYLADGTAREEAFQSLAFILGGQRDFTVPILRSFTAAKRDLDQGSLLPTEVLYGIRSVYHKETPKSRVLELTQQNLTQGQKLAVQAAAEKQQVAVNFDPVKQDTVKLYVYALERGITPEIRDALDAKAQQSAQRLPLRYGRIAIVVDTSASMAGTAQAKHRPLAIALGLRDLLAAAATERAVVLATQGSFDAFGLIHPCGDTSLATAVLAAFQTEPDALFLLTDGYENAPSGRVDEVLRAVRGLGIRTPVFQISPVAASEAAGVRSLSTEAAVLPVSQPDKLGLALVRAALTQDVEQGILGLLKVTMPALDLKL